MRFTTFISAALGMATMAFAAPAAVAEDSVDNIAPVYGDASYYNPHVGTGSCGTLHQDHEMVAALPMSQIWSGSPNCYRNAKVTNTKNGASVTVKLVDACRACLVDEGYESVVIDLSEGAFKAINGGSTTAGRISVKWDVA